MPPGVNTLVLAVLRQRILPPLVQKLHQEADFLSRQHIGRFSVFVEILIGLALGKLSAVFGVGWIDEFGKATSDKVKEWLVAELNSALPVDHPYIVSLVRIGEDPEYHYSAFFRNTLPGHHDFISPDIVPISCAPTLEDANAGHYQTFKIIFPTEGFEDYEQTKNPD